MARVTEVGAALGDRVQSATAATAAAAGQALQKIVQDATEATAVGGRQAKEVVSNAGAVRDVVDAGRRATRSISRRSTKSR